MAIGQSLWAHAAAVSRRAVMQFGLVSLAGWGGDFIVFLTLVRCGMQPGAANLISAALAVTFVYFASIRRVFEYAGRLLLGKFAVYVAYQAAAVLAASAAVGWLAHDAGLQGWAAKLVVTPVTFLANYAFMRRLSQS